MMRARVPALLLGVLILHVVVAERFRLAGVQVDLLLLVAIAAGLVAGPERGAAIGFAAGLGGDLFLDTPLGLSALVFTVVGFGVGTVQAGILRAAWWIPPLTAFAASAAGVALYAIAGAVVGQGQFIGPRLALVAAVVATLNAVLCPPLVRAAAWALTSGHPERAHV